MTGMIIVVGHTWVFSSEFLIDLRRLINLLIAWKARIDTTVLGLPNFLGRAIPSSSRRSSLKIVMHKHSVRIAIMGCMRVISNHLLRRLASREILHGKNLMALKSIGVVRRWSIYSVVCEKTLYETLLIKVHHRHVLITHSYYIQRVCWFI